MCAKERRSTWYSKRESHAQAIAHGLRPPSGAVQTMRGVTA